MKKTIALIALLASLLALASCKQDPEKYSRVVGEYDASQLKGSFLTSANEAYRIGSNSLGVPVFVSPEKAWEAFLVDYAVGIETIKNEFDLQPISKDYYRSYGFLGVQIPSDEPQETDSQCCDVSYFIDIYENSFEEAYNDHFGAPI